VPNNLGEERHVSKGLGPDRPFGQHGNVMVVTRVPVGERLFRRPMVFRAKDRCFLPEGPLGEERNDADLVIGKPMNQIIA
jgi:hypothetical protein